MILYGSFIMTSLSLPSLQAWFLSPTVSQRWGAFFGFCAECFCPVVSASFWCGHRSSFFCPCSKLAGCRKKCEHVQTGLCSINTSPSTVSFYYCYVFLRQCYIKTVQMMKRENHVYLWLTSTDTEISPIFCLKQYIFHRSRSVVCL